MVKDDCFVESIIDKAEINHFVCRTCGDVKKAHLIRGLEPEPPEVVLKGMCKECYAEFWKVKKTFYDGVDHWQHIMDTKQDYEYMLEIVAERMRNKKKD